MIKGFGSAFTGLQQLAAKMIGATIREKPASELRTTSSEMADSLRDIVSGVVTRDAQTVSHGAGTLATAALCRLIAAVSPFADIAEALPTRVSEKRGPSPQPLPGPDWE